LFSEILVDDVEASEHGRMDLRFFVCFVPVDLSIIQEFADNSHVLVSKGGVELGDDLSEELGGDVESEDALEQVVGDRDVHESSVSQG